MTAIGVQEILSQRLADIRGRVETSCRRAGRDPFTVTLVAVTKTIGPEVASLLPALGVSNLGESRPQELWRKAAALSAEVHWHLVGHLQSNKIERTLHLVRMIHSVDRLRLLTAIDAAADEARPTDVLLEVNLSREPNKHGFALEELPALIPRLADLRGVRVRGLMAMAAWGAEPDRSRATFAELRRCRDGLVSTVPPPHRLEHLSMGMSDDFELAVEEGATLIRIGTALFGGLEEART